MTFSVWYCVCFSYRVQLWIAGLHSEMTKSPELWTTLGTEYTELWSRPGSSISDPSHANNIVWSTLFFQLETARCDMLTGPNMGLFQRGMFPGVLSLDPDGSTDPRDLGPWKDQHFTLRTVSMSHFGLIKAWRAGLYPVWVQARYTSAEKVRFSRLNLCSACCCLPRQRSAGGWRNF